MIKNLRENPCPRCLILKKDILGIGTPADAQLRKKFQTDTEARRRQDIERARKLMFEKGCAIQKTQVQNLLEGRSLVPTRVSFIFSYSTILTHVKECLFRKIV